VSGPYRHISANTEDDVLVLSIELEQVKDYVLAEELRYELAHAVKRARTKKFVLDLRKMVFMTSLACVAFLGLKATVRDMDGRLILCNMADFIRKVFSAKRLLTPSQYTGSVAFEVEDTLHDALEAFAEKLVPLSGTQILGRIKPPSIAPLCR
jgi:anti-anti-sigma factor